MENDRPEGAIDVPPNVYVQCPLIGKKLRKLTDCISCEHYAGLVDRIPQDGIPFANRFMAGCKFPFARSLFEVE